MGGRGRGAEAGTGRGGAQHGGAGRSGSLVEVGAGRPDEVPYRSVAAGSSGPLARRAVSSVPVCRRSAAGDGGCGGGGRAGCPRRGPL